MTPTCLYHLRWIGGDGVSRNRYEVCSVPVTPATSDRIYFSAFGATHFFVARPEVEETGQVWHAESDLQLYLAPPLPTLHRPFGRTVAELRRQAELS